MPSSSTLIHSKEPSRRHIEDHRPKSYTRVKSDYNYRVDSFFKVQKIQNLSKNSLEGFSWMASSSSNVVGVHYRVGKKIGEGSFGVIFEGTNLLNNNQVAIKFVSSQAPQPYYC